MSCLSGSTARNHLRDSLSRMRTSPHVFIPADAGNLSVDQTQGVSLYIQVANILRFAILSGTIAPGSRLPTVVELADHFKVARITIREAIRVLAEEGLLASGRGRGIHVLKGSPRFQCNK